MIENQKTKEEIMIEIAKLYYVDGLSQAEIASVLHMSRSNVSRILQNAIASKVVEVMVHDGSMAICNDLAKKIQSKYGLKRVLISTSHADDNRCMAIVASLAAKTIGELLDENALIGISNGALCESVVEYFPENTPFKADVIQLLGGTNNRSGQNDGQQLAFEFSKKLKGNGYILQSPLMVKSKILKEMILQEKIISDTTKMYHDISVCLMDIEKTNFYISSFNEHHLSKADVLQLMELRAEACLCGRFFDKNGLPCNTGINSRIIGIELEVLEKIPIKIGVSYNSKNANAVISVLKSGYIDHLIIDEVLAKAVDQAG